MTNIINEVPQYGLRTLFAENHVFYHDFSSKARLEVSFEVGDNGFQKFKFQIQELITDPQDPNRKKQKDLLLFYLDPKDVVGELVPLIQSGAFKDRALKNLKDSVVALQKGEMKVTPAILFKRIGGTMKRAEDGKAIYREFRIERSNLNDQYWNSADPRQKIKSKTLNYVVKIMSCEGRLLQQGKGQTLIQPAKDANGKMIDVHAINFPITEVALRAIAGQALMELQAYRTSQYITVEFRRLFDLYAEQFDQKIASSKPSVSQPSNETPTSPSVDKSEESKQPLPSAPVAESEPEPFSIDTIDIGIDADDLPF